jgi:AraC-like DNA-binding protein
MPSLTLDGLHVIILLGAVQGVFLTVALATKRRNRTANRILAWTMLAFSVYLVTSVYHAAKLEEIAPHFLGLAYPLPFLFGPLIYLYAVAAADRERTFTRRDLLHLLPFAVVALLGARFYLTNGAAKLEFYRQLVAGNVPLQFLIEDPLKFVSGVIYTVSTIVFLRRHRERVKDSYSSTERVNLKWLLWLSVGSAGVWAIALGNQVAEWAGLARNGIGEDYVSLAMAILTYGIGYRALRQPEIFRFETAEWPVQMSKTQSVPVPVPVAEPAPSTEAVSTPRYVRSGLTDREASRLKQALVDSMEKKEPWRESNLTLADLAAELGTTPHKLSEVLNSEVGQTFYDFVNGYRVREVQRRIAAGEARSLKMLRLAFDAGFASKSTFNEVFKRHTSQTPSNFRQAAGA